MEIKIDELKSTLDIGDYGDLLNDYRNSSEYICDAISNAADNNISIYYSDILDFIRRNPEALNDVVSEGLYEVNMNNKYDLYKHAQTAEYMVIENDIYDHLSDALMLAALDFLKYDRGIDSIPGELADLLRCWCDDADNNDRMYEIPNKILDYLQNMDGETEC